MVKPKKTEVEQHTEQREATPSEQREAIDIIYDHELRTFKLVKVAYNLDDAEVVSLNNAAVEVAMYSIKKEFAKKITEKK